MSSLPRLAITIGDPHGIGPEITAKALSSSIIHRHCRPIVIGSVAALQRYARLSTRNSCRIVDLSSFDPGQLKPGRISKKAGRASYECIVYAAELIKNGEADAMVTAPISKEALHLAGVRYPGHTELLSALTGAKNYAMLMVAGSLRVVMVTRHLPVASVGKRLTIHDIVDTTRLTAGALEKQFRIPRPRIAVCALNPHAGENGLLGSEENKIITPAVRALAARKIAVCGPLPVDSAWQKMTQEKFDLLVAMYHDQAMIGLKCLAPEKIVNVTIGLPFIRTSPGHGTGFDIAGRNCADPRSMIEAILLAAKLSHR